MAVPIPASSPAPVPAAVAATPRSQSAPSGRAGPIPAAARRPCWGRPAGSAPPRRQRVRLPVRLVQSVPRQRAQALQAPARPPVAGPRPSTPESAARALPQPSGLLPPVPPPDVPHAAGAPWHRARRLPSRPLPSAPSARRGRRRSSQPVGRSASRRRAPRRTRIGGRCWPTARRCWPRPDDRRPDAAWRSAPRGRRTCRNRTGWPAPTRRADPASGAGCRSCPVVAASSSPD